MTTTNNASEAAAVAVSETASTTPPVTLISSGETPTLVVAAIEAAAPVILSIGANDAPAPVADVVPVAQTATPAAAMVAPPLEVVKSTAPMPTVSALVSKYPHLDIAIKLGAMTTVKSENPGASAEQLTMAFAQKLASLDLERKRMLKANVQASLTPTNPLFSLNPGETLVRTTFSPQETADLEAQYAAVFPEKAGLYSVVAEVLHKKVIRHKFALKSLISGLAAGGVVVSATDTIVGESVEADIDLPITAENIQLSTDQFSVSGEPNQRLVHITDNTLRNDLYYQTNCGDMYVKNGQCYNEELRLTNAKDCDRIDQRAKYPLYQMLASIQELLQMGDDEIAADFETPVAEVRRFHQTLDLLHQQDNAVLIEEFESGVVSLHALQYALNKLPGRLFAYSERGQLQAFTHTHNELSFMNMYLVIQGRSKVSGVNGMSEGNITCYFPTWEGKKSLTDIGLIDLAKHPEVVAELVARGKKYESLVIASSQYLRYTGNLTRMTQNGPNYIPATGRLIVDYDSMKRSEPNYGFYHALNDDNNISRRLGGKGVQFDIVIKAKSDEDYLLMSPFVYGYSLVAKRWGEIVVDGLEEIKFREDAYEKLVLPEDTKEIMFSLVSNKSPNTPDLIDGKGGGCIFLLYGPPGVGKTLSAESIAEKQKRPLYTVSVGELGTDVTTLERKLGEILTIATRWNAVLLLDEADIFLEARTDLDIHRNAMVGVFLRMLEYFQGVMFLTTNRASNLDEAFYSRINMALGFTGLSLEARQKVWTNLLGNNAKDIDVAALSVYDVNGRQIKNCINSAFSLAGAKDRAVAHNDFIRVIQKAEDFGVIMKQSRNKHGKLDTILEDETHVLDVTEKQIDAATNAAPVQALTDVKALDSKIQ